MSLLLVRQILMTIVLNTLLALPGLRDLPPRAAAVPARRPAPPPAPRVHDRRPEPALARLMRAAGSRTAARRSRRSSRCASPCSAASRSCCSRSSSSACGSCRCCPARTTSARRARTACARSGSRRRAATSSTATAACSSRRALAPVVQIVPSQLPESVLAARRLLPQGARRGRGRPARGRRPAAQRSSASSQERRTADQGRAPRAPPAVARRPQAAPVAVPPLPADALELRRLYRRLGRVIGVSPTQIHERVIEGVAEPPYSNVTIKTDVTARPSTTCASARSSSRASPVEKQYLRDYPHKELAAQLFGTAARDLAEGAQGEALPRRRGGHADRRRRPRGELRQVPARQGRLHAGRHQRARHPRRPAAG